MIEGLTLHQLQCFDAVVTEGGFQAAAEKLGRSQPSVSIAVKNLEAQLHLALFDRNAYRVVLTEAGRSFHDRSRLLLGELQKLRDHASHLAGGEESEFRIVIGDLCPLPKTLRLLRRFFDRCPATKLHLYFEAISGPWERLFNDQADLIIHHIDRTDPRFEAIDLFPVKLIPVVAPNFLNFPVSPSITPDDMRGYVQCVIRDTAQDEAVRNYYIVEGARTWTVSDQLMKREVILQGMGWGHLPEYLIKTDIERGALLPITGRFLAGGMVDIVVARRLDKRHGPVAERLWRYIEEQAHGGPFIGSPPDLSDKPQTSPANGLPHNAPP